MIRVSNRNSCILNINCTIILSFLCVFIGQWITPQNSWNKHFTWQSSTLTFCWHDFSFAMFPIVASRAFVGFTFTVANNTLSLRTFPMNFGDNTGAFFSVRFQQGIFVSQLTLISIMRRAVNGKNTIIVFLCRNKFGIGVEIRTRLYQLPYLVTRPRCFVLVFGWDISSIKRS